MGRNISMRFLISVSMLALIVSSCGDGGGLDAGETNGTDIATTDTGGASSGEDSNSSSTTESGDTGSLSDAPAPGAAVLTVDGETIEGSIHTCEVSESTLLVGASGELAGEPVEFGANGGGGPDSWIIQANVATETGEVLYNSSNTSEAEVSGESLVMRGEWVWNGDDGSLEGGEGVLSATCP